MPWRVDPGFSSGIQLRADTFNGERPSCPRGCRGRIHRHGCYPRYAGTSGTESYRVQRYWCPQCGLTISVLPADRLPYRSVTGTRLEAFFNEAAEAGSGPDPPPDELEAGSLRRAWARLQTRVATLQDAFGLLVEHLTDCAAALWRAMRQAKGTLGGILQYLAQAHQCSLLGDYRCLRLPP